MRNPFAHCPIVLLAMALAACAPATPRAAEQPGEPASAGALRPAASRPLVMAVRYEVPELVPKRVAPAAWQYTKRAFNADLALIDGAGSARPYVAESLPQLNSDSWKVFPDGRMETTYRLKPNLTWHDGQPLTAEDYVFAYRVYTAPGLGAFTSSPQDQMEEVSAPDPHSLLIRWRSLYGDAGTLVTGELDALPRHVLETPFAAYQQDPSTPDAFLSHPFWSTQFVGLGPYKLDRWEPGASIEGVAFDGHALGRPKIDRLIVRIIADENTVMTNMLAGVVDLAVDNSIRFEHAIELKRQWESGQRGAALMRPGTRHWIILQFRPDLLRTQALMDLRVRKALMHAIDREPINEALFEGQGLMAEHYVPGAMPYWSDVERAIIRHPFDPRRAEQLMNDAGFARDRSGFFASAAGERFKPDFLTDGSPLFEREMNLIQDTWARIGIDMEPRLLPAAQARLLESRTTFPDMYATSTGIRESQLNIFSAAQIASSQTRWAGQNRGGWANPDFERWWAAYNTTLDRPQRNQQVVEMMKVLSDQLPGLFLYFNISPIAHVAALRGPEMGTPETLANWNQHEWELR